MTPQIRILVAGNDQETARQLTQPLTQLGWEVFQARDAISATAAMLRKGPDAVILFGELPGGGGVLVLKRIRASVHTAMTPVIAIVGRREGDAEELHLHGADECLSPPADPAAVTAWIQERLTESHILLKAPSALIRDSDRMAALARTALLDSPPHESFDTLTDLAAHLLQTPVALVSLVDNDRQFFKSQVGLPEPWATERETPLTHSFCQWVVAGHESLVIPDARQHPVLRDNRALHEIGVIAYAGVPLSATTGEPLGSLCAIDTNPRPWSIEDMALLQILARMAEACIAVDESKAAEQVAGLDAEASGIARNLVIRALGEGIAAATDLLRRNDPRLGDSQRKGLLNLLEWFGGQIVQLAGT